MVVLKGHRKSWISAPIFTTKYGKSQISSIFTTSREFRREYWCLLLTFLILCIIININQNKHWFIPGTFFWGNKTCKSFRLFEAGNQAPGRRGCWGCCSTPGNFSDFRGCTAPPAISMHPQKTNVICAEKAVILTWRPFCEQHPRLEVVMTFSFLSFFACQLLVSRGEFPNIWGIIIPSIFQGRMKKNHNIIIQRDWFGNA